MFKEIEKQSLKENKWLPHPNIPYVMIHGTKYICTIHPGEKPMNSGSCRQHIEGKAHKTDFESGEPLNMVKDFPPLPIEAQKNLIHAKKQRFQNFEEDEDDEENISNAEPPKIVFEYRENYARFLTKDNVNFSAKEPPKPPPRQILIEPLDKWDKKFLAWKKARQMKAMGMPQRIVDKFMITNGLKKEVKEYRYSEGDIKALKKIMNSTKDRGLKRICAMGLGLALRQTLGLP